jgi:eukaryotic-like serine/threonine-protein kinase
MTPERWHQITEIFHASLERPDAERDAFLVEACRGDASLRVDVDALLSGHRAGASGAMVIDAPLPAGTCFGSCRIERLVGEGGMGQVYLARDTELGRDVAVKVLPSAFLDDQVFLERLDREAQVLASLNHPNIATIYGIERVKGRRGLVLEFVDGPTLAEILDDRRLSLEESLRIARQLADALDAAHERGIVHRDIKPANLKITGDSVLKVLDFGLAKAVATPSSTEHSGAIGVVISITGDGVIVGTPSYMSPEQARGHAVDRRTDIWAFGCVLFEMLSGRQAFAGGTRSDTIAAILQTDPAWDQLPVSTPENIRRLLRRCLEKDAKRRLRDIGDAQIEMDEPTASAITPRRANVRRWRRLAMWAVVVVSAMGVITIAPSLLPKSAPAEPSSTRFTIPRDDGFIAPPALSPDGRYLAFVGRRDGAQSIWVRPLDALDARPVAGSEGARSVFWSPDSRSVVFSTVQGGFKSIDDHGGGRVRPLPGPAGAALYGTMWLPDGRLVTGSLTRGGLFADSLDGGSPPVQITSLDLAHGEGAQLYPAMLPDGRHFLYLSEPSSTVWVASVDSKERQRLLEADAQAVYVAPGFLLFVRRQTLFAQRFDAEKLALRGEPVSLAENVMTSSAYGANFTASANGVLAYREGTIHVPTQLTWVDRTGRRLGTLGPSGRYANIELSKDGSRVVLEAFDPRTATKDIWTMDTARGIPAQLTFDSANETFPIWSPDGHWIMFGSDRHGGWQLYRRRSDGVGSDERVATTAESLVPQSWAPDGQSIVYLQRPANLGVLDLKSRGPLGLIDRARFEGFGHLDGYGQVSPDGHWLLYGSNESGNWEVYVRRFPDREGGKWKVSQKGAISARWRPDGREIFYYSAGDDHIIAVPFTGGTAPEFGTPTPLFKANLLGGTQSAIVWRFQYAVSADGRLLLNEALEDAYLRAPIHVVTNWTSVLPK